MRPAICTDAPDDPRSGLRVIEARWLNGKTGGAQGATPSAGNRKRRAPGPSTDDPSSYVAWMHLSVTPPARQAVAAAVLQRGSAVAAQRGRTATPLWRQAGTVTYQSRSSGWFRSSRNTVSGGVRQQWFPPESQGTRMTGMRQPGAQVPSGEAWRVRTLHQHESHGKCEDSTSNSHAYRLPGKQIPNLPSPPPAWTPFGLHSWLVGRDWQQAGLFHLLTSSCNGPPCLNVDHQVPHLGRRGMRWYQ